jgi:putative membrane protein
MMTTLLHGYYDGPFLLAWDPVPWAVLLLMLGAGAYGLALRRIEQIGLRSVPRSYPVAFYAGLFAMAVALIGPLDVYNENSFALHMGQHVVMMLVAAPLLILGRPVHIALWAFSPRQSGSILKPVLRQAWLRAILTVITHPLVVLLFLTVNLLIWHLPRFYVAALESTLVHELEHALFMGTALLFWWVIIDPIPRHHRVRPEVGIGMLFVAGTVGDLLALYLIFAPDVIYPFYLASEGLWGISHHADQRVGGLVMLVVGTAVYFGATFWLIARNFGNTESRDGIADTRLEHAPTEFAD